MGWIITLIGLIVSNIIVWEIIVTGLFVGFIVGFWSYAILNPHPAIMITLGVIVCIVTIYLLSKINNTDNGFKILSTLYIIAWAIGVGSLIWYESYDRIWTIFASVIAIIISTILHVISKIKQDEKKLNNKLNNLPNSNNTDLYDNSNDDLYDDSDDFLYDD
jgi:hypothetical protein